MAAIWNERFPPRPFYLPGRQGSVNWSFSAGKSYEKCPRMWFFRQVVAHHAAKDPLRREAYLLSKLDSLWSWRGRLVDNVITRQVVPALTAGRDLDLSALLAVARENYNAQLAFTAAHRLREAGMRPGQHPDFLALREVEKGASLSDADLAKAWGDTETALTNLLAMKGLLERLQSATLLFPQRALAYKRTLPDGESVTVRAVPDLLAFFSDAPPLSVDWKVHTHATADYREQLAGYAFALSRSAGQWGLPNLSRLNATDVELIEAQLLTNELRSYTLTDEDVRAVESYHVESALRMQALLSEREKGNRNPYTVPTTTDLRTCEGCNFKALCWKGSAGPRFQASPTSL